MENIINAYKLTLARMDELGGEWVGYAYQDMTVDQRYVLRFEDVMVTDSRLKVEVMFRDGGVIACILKNRNIEKKIENALMDFLMDRIEVDDEMPPLVQSRPTMCQNWHTNGHTVESHH
jgi:hypothetical protein